MRNAPLPYRLNDVQYALRQLVKAPAFHGCGDSHHCSGIGANTAIFSVVNGVLLNPLPYPNANRIVLLYERLPNFEDVDFISEFSRLAADE